MTAKKKAAKKRVVAKKIVKKAVKAPVKKPVKALVKAAPKTAKVTLDVYDVQNVPEHQHFYFVNGVRVKNVKELAEVMDKIEQEVFDYHVTMDKNDFHSWVNGVFQDMELAEKLLGVTSPKHLQFTIYKHVADKALKKR